MAAILVIVLTLFARAATAQPAAPADSDRCLTCHGMANLAVRDSLTGPAQSFSVSLPQFAASVHGRLRCVQCHADVGSYPHHFPAGRPQVTCDQDCHARGADGTPYSHRTAAADFAASAHGASARGTSTDRPTCLTCHGAGNPHSIRSLRGSSPRARMALCVDCHDDRARMIRNGVEPDAVSSYRRSFHYKAITFGAGHAAVCQDCHTSHRILPRRDPRSSVAPAALPTTCGQAACHPGARTHFAVSGANHLDLRVRHEPVLRAEERLFALLTGGTMAMLVIGIVLDVNRKFGWLARVRTRAAAAAGVIRWRPSRPGRSNG